MQVVVKALQCSMNRMQVDRLDCVQFHWWDYRDKRYLDALGHLSDLQQEGLIRMYAEVHNTYCKHVQINREGKTNKYYQYHRYTVCLEIAIYSCFTGCMLCLFERSSFLTWKWFSSLIYLVFYLFIVIGFSN